MRDTDAGILARIAAVENLQASTNFCPSSHRDTAFWSSFSGAKRFYYSFCRGYGLTGCQVLLAFNKNGLYIAHYWEAADGADREMRTNDIIKFIQNGDPDRLPEPDPDPNEGRSIPVYSAKITKGKTDLMKPL